MQHSWQKQSTQQVGSSASETAVMPVMLIPSCRGRRFLTFPAIRDPFLSSGARRLIQGSFSLCGHNRWPSSWCGSAWPSGIYTCASSPGNLESVGRGAGSAKSGKRKHLEVTTTAENSRNSGVTFLRKSRLVISHHGNWQRMFSKGQIKTQTFLELLTALYSSMASC